MTPQIPPQFLQRADESDDALFYAVARLVTHIDAATIDRLQRRLGLQRNARFKGFVDIAPATHETVRRGENDARLENHHLGATRARDARQGDPRAIPPDHGE